MVKVEAGVRIAGVIGQNDFLMMLCAAGGDDSGGGVNAHDSTLSDGVGDICPSSWDPWKWVLVSVLNLMVALPLADGSGDQGGAHSDSGGTVEGQSDREGGCGDKDGDRAG